jgi:hypothetical protein
MKISTHCHPAYSEEELDIKYRHHNFISADKTRAINSYGEVFSIGDHVTHDGDDKINIGTITSFYVDPDMLEVKITSSKGYAAIDFLTHVKQNEQTN